MSRFRFDNNRNTSLLPTDCTRRRSRVRNAVTATDIASFGSFLFDRPLPSTRVRAANVAGTSTTVSPALTSCCARRNPSPSAPSIAHVRDGNGAAHVNNLSTWPRLARIFSRARSASSAPNSDGGVGRLMRVDPDDHLHLHPPRSLDEWNRGGHSYFGSCSR